MAFMNGKERPEAHNATNVNKWQRKGTGVGIGGAMRDQIWERRRGGGGGPQALSPGTYILNLSVLAWVPICVGVNSLE